MSNCIIAFNNKADLVTFDGAAGSYQSTLPLSNLLNPVVQKVARTTDHANSSTKFEFLFSELTLVQMFLLANTNASLTSTFRLRLYGEDSPASELYDSGVVTPYPAGSKPQGTIPFGAPNWWTAKPTYTDLAKYQRNLYHIVPGAVHARYGLFELFDTANPDGYFQAGRLFLGDIFQPQQNMEHGAAVQMKSLSTMVRAESGTRYFSRRHPDISFPIAMPRLVESEARRVVDLHATVDTSGEVFFLWDPEDKAYWMGRSVFGQLAQLDPITHPQFGNYATAWQIEGTL
jgi:hypothetical protein